MPAGIVRSKARGFSASHASYSCGLALLVILFGCRGLQNAIADGDTRTISMHHVHTNEDITITYKRDGRYDEAALEKLNWFLRDWRRGKETRMDPRLIDLLWEVQREAGSKQPINVVCGYRSPATNAMLRRRSRGVARFSQHILGHAVDFYIPGVPLEELRVIGLRMQRGGVGFYPTSGSPFVHMDTGGVRMWPQMTRDQLMHVFPDGRTVYLPTDGHPLPGYALALADLHKRGQTPGETWADKAHEEGLDEDVVSADDMPPRANSQNETPAMTQADGAAAAQKAAAAATAPAEKALLAALEREAARRRQAAAPAAMPSSNAGGASYQLASYTGSAPEPADITPSQVISARGLWDSASDSASAEQAARLRAAAARQALTASVADAAGTITPPPGALEDHTPPELMLAYAAQPEEKAKASAEAPAPPVVEAQAQVRQPPAETTIAVKRGADQAVSTVITAHPRLAATTKAGTLFDNPWLDAVMISPSVRRYLTVLTLGTPDYRTLAALVEKPARSVMMTFGAEPNPGMTNDRFSGSAIVFISTVTYEPPTHTALLQ